MMSSSLRTPFRLFVLGVVMLTPLRTAATDLPASYFVEERPFKAAIAGTNLTFDLYSDATCTTLVASATVAVENVATIVKVKQCTPKNDAKLPNTVELRATLGGVPQEPALYLQVFGTGVVPVGGACQAQSSTGGLPRTVFVPASGTPVANGTALLAAAAAMTGSATQPPTLQLDDGTYDLGTTTLVLTGIVLQGRSTDHTIVTASGSAAFGISQGGTVRTDSDMRGLTINNTGGNTFAAGIVFVGASGKITDVNVNTAGGTNAYGLTNAFGNLIVRGVRVVVDATSQSVAFAHDLGALGARSRVSASTLAATSLAPLNGEGVRSSQGGALSIRDCVLSGTAFYVNAQVGSAPVVVRSSAVSSTPNGAVTCRAVTTAATFSATTWPTESWATGDE